MSAADQTRSGADDEASGGFFGRLKGLFGKQENGELSEALDETKRDGSMRLPRARREMIERVIAFDEKRVADVMAPRADIVAVDMETPLDGLIKAFAEAGHSRLADLSGRSRRSCRHGPHQGCRGADRQPVPVRAIERPDSEKNPARPSSTCRARCASPIFF